MTTISSIEQRAAAELTQVDPIDAALERVADDPGAVFEPTVLSALCRIRVDDHARFARIRAAVKEARTVSMVEFDRLTTARDNDDDGGAMFAEVEPWPDPVDGAALLRDIVATLQRHVIADQSTFYAAALWCVHTWVLDAMTVSPIANITAPEMRCGKSVLLTALSRLSFRPLQVANIAPAALFRAIEAWTPTLLIDEVDSFLRENEEARGIINSGFTRDSAFVIRCAGDDHTPTKYSTWGAKALCGIGKIAETLADRSVPLRLRRKTPAESVQNIRRSDPAHWAALCARTARWADDHRDALARSRPAPVDGLNDRANDCWEPLLAIADEVGDEWPKCARLAAMVLHGMDADAPSIGAQLLADIREAFGRRDRMFTAELLAALVADDESPWPTWNRGKPMSARQLSARLAEFGIRPNTIRHAGNVAKGYTRDQFDDAFARYLPADTPFSSVTPLQRSNDGGFSDFLSVTPALDVTDEKGRKASSGAGCNGVTDRNPLPAGEGAQESWENDL